MINFREIKFSLLSLALLLLSFEVLSSDKDISDANPEFLWRAINIPDLEASKVTLINELEKQHSDQEIRKRFRLIHSLLHLERLQFKKFRSETLFEEAQEILEKVNAEISQLERSLFDNLGSKTKKDQLTELSAVINETIVGENDDLETLAYGYYRLARLKQSNRDSKGAIETAKKSIELYRRLNLDDKQAYAQLSLAYYHKMKADFDIATDILTTVSNFAEQSDKLSIKANALLYKAYIRQDK